MKNTIVAATAVVFVAAAGFVTLSTSQTQSHPGRPSPSAAAHASKVQRGEYLVKSWAATIATRRGRWDRRGRSRTWKRFLSGHAEEIGRLRLAKNAEPFLWSGFATNTAFSGPWGVSYAFNLTPEQTQGSASGPRRCSCRPFGPAGTGGLAADQPADALAGIPERHGR